MYIYEEISHDKSTTLFSSCSFSQVPIPQGEHLCLQVPCLVMERFYHFLEHFGLL